VTWEHWLYIVLGVLVFWFLTLGMTERDPDGPL
jgi:hypothetical protein